MRTLILLIPFLLTACGQSGPLYLPGTQPAPATKPVTGAPKPDPAKPEEEEAKPAVTPTQP